VCDFIGDFVGILPCFYSVSKHSLSSLFGFSFVFSTAIDGRTPNQHVLVRDNCVREAAVVTQITANRQAFAVVDVQPRNTMFGSRQKKHKKNRR
jgi:hypothetical protein